MYLQLEGTKPTGILHILLFYGKYHRTKLNIVICLGYFPFKKWRTAPRDFPEMAVVTAKKKRDGIQKEVRMGLTLASKRYHLLACA